MTHPTRKIRGVYVITDESLRPGRTHVDIACAAFAGGAQVVQLRDKTSDDRRMVEVGSRIAELASQYGATFIVNDRVRVAMACGAHGVHVGQEDEPPAQVRRLMRDAIIGVSVSTPEEAQLAQQDGADYVAIGPIFPTSTKPDAGEALGVRSISEVRKACTIPVVAIGGISLENICEVVQAGADSVAVVSAVVCADDMVAATAGLVEAFESSYRQRGCW